MNEIILSNRIPMPQMGYGVFQIQDAVQCEQCVGDALETGYRLLDTAAAYLNEKAVGRAIARSGVPREELFITTKLWIQDSGYDNTLRAFDASLKSLGLDYLDLYLIHQPFGDYYGSWQAMERLYREKRVKAIGVSNFEPDRLADLCLNHEITPMVNQIEIHPFHQQTSAIRAMKDFGIQTQAWGPLSEGQRDIFRNKFLMKIGGKYGKTAAQVILRWHIQRGVAVIPKSVHRERMAENFNVWDFALTDKDMAEIAKLDIGYSEIVDIRSVSTAKWLNGWKIHA